MNDPGTPWLLGIATASLSCHPTNGEPVSGHASSLAIAVLDELNQSLSPKEREVDGPNTLWVAVERLNLAHCRTDTYNALKHSCEVTLEQK